MPKVSDYVSGNILSLIKKGFRYLKYLDTPIVGSIVRRNTLKELKKCDAHKVSVAEAGKLIRQSSRCAVGQRICNVLHGGADFGQSVFLDELADALVQAGKAEYVDKDHAIRTIADNHKGAIMLTRVSGKHMEICRSIAKNCIYWNSEKHGVKCIQRNIGRK